MFRKIYIILILLSIGNMAFPQSYSRKNTANTNAWLMYFGNHKFTNKLGLHAELQLRRNDIIKNPQQLLLRTGLDFYTPKARYTMGYAFVSTHPYGEFPVAFTFPEHRSWQQVLVNNPIGRFKLSHRYRLEQRWMGNAVTGEFANGRYENRFRYMARVNVPLNTANIEPGAIYLGLYNETFVNFGKEVGYNIFDQNRAFVALGYHFGKIGKVEFGYLYQAVQQRKLYNDAAGVQNIIENNHTLQLSLSSDLSIVK